MQESSHTEEEEEEEEEALLDALTDVLNEGEIDVEEIVPILEVVEFSFEQSVTEKSSFRPDQEVKQESVLEKSSEHEQYVHDEQPVLEWSAREPEQEVKSPNRTKLDEEMMMPVQEAPETLDSHVEVFSAAEAMEENTITSEPYLMEE